MSVKNGISHIILRAEGNAQLGLGHVYRLFSLSQMLANKFNFTFVSKSNIKSILNDSPCRLEMMPTDLDEQDEPSWLKSKFDPSEHILIVDGYDFSDQYFSELTKQGYKVVYIDDFKRNVQTDVLVNLAINLAPNDYPENENQRVLTGSKYALLRPEFNQPVRAEHRNDLLVAFGATDVANLGAKAVEAGLRSERFDKIHVISGATHSQELTHIAEKHSNVALHHNLSASEMVDVMDSCKAAFCSPSGISYELCSRRIPFFVGYYADNQKQFYEGLAQNRLGHGMGDITTYGSDHFLKALETIEQIDTAQIIESQKQYFDLRSTVRWAHIIQSLERGLTIRPCEERDIDAVFEMANDPVVRANSYHSEEITYDVHVNWFKNKLASQDSYLYSLEIHKNMAGFIRFDIIDDHAVIGLIVMEAYRGQRLASPMLALACQTFQQIKPLPVHAFIKKSNMVSSKSFKGANFEHLKDELVDGVPSVVLRLTP